MTFTSLSIEGSWIFSPDKFPDERGSFHEVFQLPTLSDTLGFGFEVKQVNQSVSKAGVIRGIHWADVPPGQAKYVFCSKGAIWDFVVDIRLGSPTFGQWAAAEVTADNGKCVLISEGLGHLFLSLEDDTVVNYLCSEPFSPKTEREINPLDKDLAIPFESFMPGERLLLSPKDKASPTLQEAQAAGILPLFVS
jgi:dTDP-4-dehydrorhamnose 3,5-epimerase